MAPKPNKKPRTLNVVKQELKYPETRSKLMEQTDFEAPLSEEQIEEPKKYTRRKRENTLDAFPTVVKPAEAKENWK